MAYSEYCAGKGFMLMDGDESSFRNKSVPKRILSSLIGSIAAGVVPRTGAPYIAIGRGDEISALLSDLEKISEGGSAMRFIIGRYGSGKSFLMQLIRGYATERGFITADADLSPERRICSGNGGGIATYRELIKNLACRASPDGGALPVMISKWLSEVQRDVAETGIEMDSPNFRTEVSKRIYSAARQLQDYVGGFDFSSVISDYYEAFCAGDDEKRSCCLKWLRGEYRTKTEAKRDLHVGDIIGDDNWQDMIKLLAVFARMTGYRGMVVFIDECVNLYKITNRVSRENNYEKLLSLFNDTMQGRSEGLAWVFGGTPQFLEDTRRGLFSYEALRSRLCDSRFDSGEYKNMLGPVIRLRRLSDNELLALLARMTDLHAQYYNWDPPVTENDMQSFLKVCLSRAGADALLTPRELLRDYMAVLGILLQNKDAVFSEVVGADLKTDDNVISYGREGEGSLSESSVSYGAKIGIQPDDINI